MDPRKNKRLLASACAAMGIEVDPLASPHDLYDIVICRRKQQKVDSVKPPPTSKNDVLDESTFKTEEMQRMCAELGSGAIDEGACVAEVDRRWQMVRDAKLGAYGNAIYIEQETSSNKELMAQFEADGCRVILREKAGVYISGAQLEPVLDRIPMKASPAPAAAESEPNDVAPPLKKAKGDDAAVDDGGMAASGVAHSSVGDKWPLDSEHGTRLSCLLEAIQLDASIAPHAKNAAFEAGKRYRASEIDKEALMKVLNAEVGGFKLFELMKVTIEPAPEPTAEEKQKLMADAAERRANKTGASEPSSAVDPPIAASEVAVTSAPDLEALATLLAGKEMTEEERIKIVTPLMQSLDKVMPGAMQASAVKRFVEWMHPKMHCRDVLELVNFSEPARYEEYKHRMYDLTQDCEEKPLPETDESLIAAKRDALTGIGRCIFS